MLVVLCLYMPLCCFKSLILFRNISLKYNNQIEFQHGFLKLKLLQENNNIIIMKLWNTFLGYAEFHDLAVLCIVWSFNLIVKEKSFPCIGFNLSLIISLYMVYMYDAKTASFYFPKVEWWESEFGMMSVCKHLHLPSLSN